MNRTKRIKMLENFTKEEQEAIVQEVLSKYGISTTISKQEMIEEAKSKLITCFTTERDYGSVDSEEEEYKAIHVFRNVVKLCDIVTGNCKCRTNRGTLRLTTDKTHIKLSISDKYRELLNKMIDLISEYI